MVAVPWSSIVQVISWERVTLMKEHPLVLCTWDTPQRPQATKSNSRSISNSPAWPILCWSINHLNYPRWAKMVWHQGVLEHQMVCTSDGWIRNHKQSQPFFICKEPENLLPGQLEPTWITQRKTSCVLQSCLVSIGRGTSRLFTLIEFYSEVPTMDMFCMLQRVVRRVISWWELFIGADSPHLLWYNDL